MGTRSTDAELGSEYSVPEGLSPSAAYEHLVHTGKIARDDRQLLALIHMDTLHTRVCEHVGAGAGGRGRALDAAATGGSSAVLHREPVETSSGFKSLFSSSFGGLFGKKNENSLTHAHTHTGTSVRVALPGLYVYGGPGSGKTFVMDLFYRCLPPASRKRRVHFHAFMLDVHARLHAVRGRQKGDPIPPLAGELAGETWIMCFDEMQVTDVGDAMIMRRLFSELMARNVVVVATSNRAPRELYANGLQRELFLPFIDLIEARCTVHCMNSDKDYRMLGTLLRAGQTWMCADTVPDTAPTSDGTEPARTKSHHAHSPHHGHSAMDKHAVERRVTAAFEAAWRAAVGDLASVQPATLTTQGRNVCVPAAVPARNVARFTFADLCSKPLYSADYQVVAQTYGTIFLDGVPRLTLSERNEVRRFITLIDTLYEHRVKLVVTAAALPTRIFSPIFADSESGGHAKSPDGYRATYDEVFAFDRTVSRLTEMQSEEYLRSEWRPLISQYKRVTDAE